MHGLCDVILSLTWRHIQNGGLVIFNALLQYGYQIKGLVYYSKTKVTLLYAIWRHIQVKCSDIFNPLLQYGYQMNGLIMNNSNPIWRHSQDG
jgi:hypothetical protein